jgi:GAF domain-containing protein
MVKEIAGVPGHPAADDRIAELERTLDSLREDSEVAHVLLGLSGVLAEVRSVEETLDLAVQTVSGVFTADRCFAVTYTGESPGLRVLAHDGFDADGVKRLRRLAESTIGLPVMRSALEHGHPVFVEDATKEPLLSAQETSERGLGAFVALPLVRWGEEVAGLGIEFAKPRTFGSKETAMARGITRLLGVALVNSRRFNMLASLRSFGLSVARKLSLSSVIEDVAWGAVELLSGDSARVYFLDATHESLVEAGAYTDRSSKKAHSGEEEPLSRIDLHEEPWSGLMTGQAVVATNVGTEGDPISVVAAPIPGEQAPILGAVVVFFRRRLASSPEEVEALNVLAGQAGMAVENANRFERQRQVARSLQEGLLSTEMPEMKSCTVAAVYEPASGDKDIGGDFYDVFELSDGRYGVAVGDVSGKGAEAAARTVMVKYMMRAFAAGDPSPGPVLAQLNDALARELDPDRFATLVYGVLDPKALKFTIARAGHPPPMLFRHETQTVEAMEHVEGTVLGAFEGQTYMEADFSLAPGDVFLLYTDGLIEARSDEGFYGRRRIEVALKKFGADLSMQDLTKRLYKEAADFGTIGDDTVIFALQCRGDE